MDYTKYEVIAKKSYFVALTLMFILFASTSFGAINSNIPIVNLIPSGAQKIACGSGWTVYSQMHQDSACTLYLENNRTGERYRLLRTKGEGSGGTRINIKAKNSFAYGKNEYYKKNAATFEYGYIETIEEVFVLDSNWILVAGIPDSRNWYNYVISLRDYEAIHIPAYDVYIQTVMVGGKPCVEFLDYTYKEGYGRVGIRAIFDINGNRIKQRELHESVDYLHNTSDFRTRHCITFYMWDRGDMNSYGQKSAFGHSFVHIPGLGYVGYGGVVSEDSELYKFATNSCSIYVSSQQLDAVYTEFRRWQKFTPDYLLMRHDCTSFVLDIADAAGIEYGSRIEVQWPSYFMKKLKKYNP